LIYTLVALVVGLTIYIYTQNTRIKSIANELREQQAICDAEITSLDTKLKAQLNKCKNAKTKDAQQVIIDRLIDSIKEVEDEKNAPNNSIGTHTLII